jgi:acetyltransferase-like isoleucine patch superfamily enzyme
MTEKEKRDQGLLYLSMDAELTAERQQAKEKIFRLNQLSPLQQKEKESLLRGLLGATGENFWMETPFYCDYGYHISIGENFYANHNCMILDCAPVTIGDDVMFGPGVSLFAVGHPLDPEERAKGFEYAKPITIGSRVWIGGNVSVMPGVTIGDGCVIGAGSVVTRDIPANSVAVGNPCRVQSEIR